MSDLRQRTVSTGAWVTAGFAASQLLRLISNIILARLLFEEAFALMAIVNAVIQGLTMFSDLGLSPSVIQSKRGAERDFLNTAWTLSVIRSCLLGAIACIAAWPIATFYTSNDPAARELLFLIPIVAVGTALSGFASSKLWTANRELNMARPAMIDLAAQILSLGVMMFIAYQTRSVYALAIGSVVSSGMTVALSHLALPGEGNRFRLERSAVHDLIRFGKWIFLSTVISFFALQLDRLAFARLFALEEVGVYAIAAGLAMILPELMGRLQGMVAFPAFARLSRTNGEITHAFRRVKLPMLILGSYLAAMIIGCAQSFVALAYDSRYADAGLYIQILTVGAAFATTVWAYFAVFLATGNVRSVAMFNLTKVIVFAALIWPATVLFGFVGAICAVVVADMAKFLAAIPQSRRLGLTGHSVDILLIGLATAVGFLTFFLTSNLAPELHPLALLALQGGIISVVYMPVGAKGLALFKAAQQTEIGTPARGSDT